MVSTITLRAARFETPPRAGMILMSRDEKILWRVIRVTRVIRAGDHARDYYRLVRERLPPGSAVKMEDVLPWPASLRPRSRGRGASTDPGPNEPAAARLARIRAKAPLLLDMAIAAIRAGRLADQVARLARAARVGWDNGVHLNRDRGPGLRLRAARSHETGLILREADVEMVWEHDPELPNRTVRRTRRSDPLRALRLAGTVTRRHVEAVHQLRRNLEGAEPSMPCTGQGEVHVPGHQRSGVPLQQIKHATAARLALEAVGPEHRSAVLWVAVGGTLDGYALQARVRRASAIEALSLGLERLAEHYFGDEVRPVDDKVRIQTSYFQQEIP